jgi:hypothetical protein
MKVPDMKPVQTLRRTIYMPLTLIGVAIATNVEAAGVFNGSAYLIANESVVNTGSDPNYGILMACWFKRSGTGDNNRLFVSVTNNSAAGSRRSLNFGHNNSVLQVETYDGTSSPAFSANSYAANQWYPAFAWYGASDNREAKLGSNSWGSNSNNRPNVTGLIRTAIGTLWVNDGPNPAFNHSGKLAEVGVWTGINSSDRNAIVEQYLNGARPVNITAPANSLKLYQPLRASDDELGSVGPSFTPSGMTFDAADHPPVRLPGIRPHLYRTVHDR